jgi:hypothetical protein
LENQKRKIWPINYGLKETKEPMKESNLWTAGSFPALSCNPPVLWDFSKPWNIRLYNKIKEPPPHCTMPSMARLPIQKGTLPLSYQGCNQGLFSSNLVCGTSGYFKAARYVKFST